MRITATFLDEISHDIPHQNWGREEWDRDFAAMKAIGIDTVVLIRSGYKRWMTYPSRVLAEAKGCFEPSVDLVRLFLDLSEKHNMAFYFGTYDSFLHWGGDTSDADVRADLDLCKRAAEEAWNSYGSSPAFKGWYLTKEFPRASTRLVESVAELGRHCKALANLPTLISPFIDGRKAVDAFSDEMTKVGITPEQHEKEWNDILAGLSGAVDIVAFQDGHVDFAELREFLEINKTLADRNGLECWTNSETFDRDMPIKFLPIQWEKLLLKLRAAEAAGYTKALTFEFSHFMSPNSCYPQAHGLYNRYREYSRKSV